MQTLTSPQLESHSYRRSHSTANSTKPPVILSSEPPDAIAKLIIDPTCRRRPRAPTHVLQRRRTQTIINRPKLPLEIATSYFAEFIGRSATVEDELYAKEPNASYVARQALRVRRRWLNYVIETGFRLVGCGCTRSGGLDSRTDRCEVFIAGVSRTPRMVVIEELGAEGWFSDQGAGV
ncbi:polyamine oxidase [Aspergillus lentulus]|nr:polyamine oxidase [Aspergillus lentulus]